MFSARLYIRILLQVVAIVLVAGLGVAGIVTGRAVILGFVALFIAAWLISLLVYYLNASNRRIQLFLDAIDDENHIPIKIRAKLKIGAAEVYYKSSKGLRYPLTSRVEIKRR